MVSKLKVVVTDPIVSRFKHLFRELAPEHDWCFVADLSPDEQSAHILSADVLVCARLTATDAAKCPARLVHVTGSGTDRVALAQLPSTTAVATTSHHERSIAEHILMVIFAHQRRLFQVTDQLRSGSWRTVATDANTEMFRTFKDLTIGFVGMGGIGSHALKAVHALGAQSVAVRRNVSNAQTTNDKLLWTKTMDHLPELLECSDVVVLCLPLLQETTGLISTNEFNLMRSDSLLVNVSRGPIVDSAALAEALEQSRIGGAALDVWWDAPVGTSASKLTRTFANDPRVIATPHFSGHAHETFVARVQEICSNIHQLATVSL